MSRAPRRIALALAAGIALADASIVTLGLPSILLELGSTVEGVALVLIVYTGVLAVALPGAARLAGRVGPARLGVWGIGLFIVASLGCGAVNSIGPLLALRGVQGLGGAAGAGGDLLACSTAASRGRAAGSGSPRPSSARPSARRSAAR